MRHPEIMILCFFFYRIVQVFRSDSKIIQMFMRCMNSGETREKFYSSLSDFDIETVGT